MADNNQAPGAVAHLKAEEFTSSGPVIDSPDFGQIHHLTAEVLPPPPPQDTAIGAAVDTAAAAGSAAGAGAAAAITGAGSLSADATLAPTEAADTAAFTGTVARVGARARFEQKLSQDPGEIRDAARSLVQAIKDEIEALRGQNESDVRDFIDFLEMLARGLSQLADALDNMIAAAPDQQPMFRGTAGKIAEQLEIGLFEYLEKHRADIAGYSIKLGLAVAGLGFLHACGVAGDALSIIKAIFKK